MTQRHKTALLPLIFFISLFTGCLAGQTEPVERIYAVVNDQLITYSEMKNTELQMIQMLNEQYKGEELKKEIEKMKSGLLDTLIRQKLVLSKAKSMKYDVEYMVDDQIKNIKKQYSFNSDEELRKALISSGLDYETWRKQMTSQFMQQKLIYDEIGSKISVDNSQIMAYFRAHEKEFTVPLTLTLDAVYLPLTLDPETMNRQKAEIDQALMDKKPFTEVAQQYSQLPADENKHRLGTFKSGELDPKLEEAAKTLKTAGSVTPWIETDSGWYRLSLVERVDEHLKEYKDVRGEIERIIHEGIQEEKLKAYIEELRKNSYIKIIE